MTDYFNLTQYTTKYISSSTEQPSFYVSSCATDFHRSHYN